MADEDIVIVLVFLLKAVHVLGHDFHLDWVLGVSKSVEFVDGANLRESSLEVEQVSGQEIVDKLGVSGLSEKVVDQNRPVLSWQGF